MKKTVATLLAVVMSFGVTATAFGQTINTEFTYNVLVNGDKVNYTADDAINVNGTTMFTADSYTSDFVGSGLTVQSVEATGNAFMYEGKNYYPLRNVANENKLNVFWDSGTSTALVITTQKYDQIRSLMDALNKQALTYKKLEMDMKANADLSMTMAGSKTDLKVPLDMSIKMDMGAPFMKIDMEAKVMDETTKSTIYDDGQFSYIFDSTQNKWMKTASSLAQSLEMMKELSKGMTPSLTGLASDLSIAGLKISKVGTDTVLEGDMYMAETFKSLDLDSIMNTALNSMDADMSIKYDMPNTMYVKYVIDSFGNVKTMAMKFAMGMNLTADGETIELKLNLNADVPRYVIDGKFDTVIPEEVKANAIEMPVPSAEIPAVEAAPAQ